MSNPAKSVNKSRTSGLDGYDDSYDHAINLVDTTEASSAAKESVNRDDSPGRIGLVKRTTRESVRESLNRRKYAKWRQTRFESNEDNVDSNEPIDTEEPDRARPQSRMQETGSRVLDFASQHEPEMTKKQKKAARKKKEQEQSAVDILYENQRGSFICGIPLYSHSSLLNFDPAPWVTKDYKSSAVNITNAQVPDPSWEWDWKHWYVDMNGDVDEDGWQYSFAFFGNFAWHGTHPWFHSYVRRRRWLRRRVKKQMAQPGKAVPSSMSQAHKLNTDYFTIHSKRAKSPARALDGPQTARPESYISYRSVTSLDEGIPEEINNIASLLKAIRMSHIDREKIDAVKKFLISGGEELVYLHERIPEITSMLVFQNSRRQLLEFVRQTADDAKKHRDEHDAEEKPEGEAETRRIDNLLAAAEAIDDQIRGLEYWSDRKHVLAVNDDASVKTPLNTIFDAPAPHQDPESNPADNIKGIADEAEVGLDGTHEVIRKTHAGDETSAEDEGKGKGKAAEEDGRNEEEKSSPRLRADQVLIPDDHA